ncbi:MAG: hypothetical protein HFF84_07225 [Oscillibacter sp.]|nr:hypothetical protein [Oscillibacter sp.]
MGKYRLSLRQKILRKKDVPASEIVFRIPRGSVSPAQDYAVIVKYDLVWWPDSSKMETGGCCLAQFENSGSA